MSEVQKHKYHKSVGLHYGGGIVISLLFFFFPYYELELGMLYSFLISMGAGIFFGSLKEYSDHQTGKKHNMPYKYWDWLDWIFTIAGSITIPLIYVIL